MRPAFSENQPPRNDRRPGGGRGGGPRAPSDPTQGTRPASSESRQSRSDRRAGGGGLRAPFLGGSGGGVSGGGGCGGGGHRQEWVPRWSAPPILNYHPPPNGGGNGDPSPNPDSTDGRGRQRQHHRPQQRQVRPTHTPRPPQPEVPVDPTADASLPQLVQEIQDKLAKGAVECMICYDMVRRSAAIWSCSSCYSIFHLHCIKKWARSPTSADLSAATAAAEGSHGLNWRCPGCQAVQITPSRDLQYTCFCGERRDPPNDLYLTPHSCGEPCGRPLDRGPSPGDSETGDGIRCPHMCVLQCHPGPCPPCKAFAPRSMCPCGKESIVRRCSDQKTPLLCGRQCNKLLSCGRHRCSHICHIGSCDPCQVLFTASCFCKKKTEVVLCGEMAVRGEIKEIHGLFSCNSVCGKTLACGNHLCSENCHPGPCGECEFLPSKIKTCHCGKTALKKKRESCLDVIPTCAEVCGKLLLCGIHRCKENCHEGNCAPCLVMVSQKCRCGSTSRMVECYKTSDEKELFLCEKPCGQKKNCGRHRCSERCCPLSSNHIGQFSGDWDPHLCKMSCGKRLRCGQHSCQSLCHSGHCPPCLETIFSELSCACGKTSIPPPLPCGTPYPSCPHLCLVSQPCGHNASHTCHFGDCPPCSIPVAKECIGGHVVLRNVPCGSKDIRCNQLCGKTRQCGMHACARTCHPPPCDTSYESGSTSSFGSSLKASCAQVCGAPRRDCRHTCTSTCHPLATCPDLRCDFSVTITCSCGRVTASVPCGAGGNNGGFHVDTVFEASIVQKLPVPLQPVEGNGKKVPLGQRKLTCDEDCARLERKKVLADAFDITPNLDALHFGEYATVSELLSDMFRREPKWVVGIEERFKSLVLGKSKGGLSSSLKVHVFCPMVKDKRDAVRQMAERWKLSVHAAGWEPRRFLVVHVTPKSKPPARILGSRAGVPIIGVHPSPVFDPLIDMDPRLVVALLDLPRDADISALVLRFGGECELVWLNDKNALAVFSDPVRAATAMRRLDHGSTYHGAVVLLQNGGASAFPGNNVWGVGSKDGGGGSAKSGNPWKKVVAQEESGSWGAAGVAFPVWRGNGVPIPASRNPWNILDSDAVTNSSAAELTEVQDPTHRVEEGSLKSELKTGASSSSGPAAGIGESGMLEEVDDWEEAYELDSTQH